MSCFPVTIATGIKHTINPSYQMHVFKTGSVECAIEGSNLARLSMFDTGASADHKELAWVSDGGKNDIPKN